MPTQPIYSIKKASYEDDPVIAQHFYQMWLDNEVPQEAIVSDWLSIALNFIENARHHLHFQSFIAISEDGKILGSASCQLFAGLYPHILQDSYQKRGYVWGVYVESAYRRQGIAKALTLETVSYLESIGCTQVLLNASPSGKPVYSQIGFVPGNLMEFNLKQ